MSDDKLIDEIEEKHGDLWASGLHVTVNDAIKAALREYASRADAPKDDKSEPSEDEMGQARSITDAINAQVDSEHAPKDAPVEAVAWMLVNKDGKIMERKAGMPWFSLRPNSAYSSDYKDGCKDVPLFAHPAPEPECVVPVEPDIVASLREGENLHDNPNLTREDGEAIIACIDVIKNTVNTDPVGKEFLSTHSGTGEQVVPVEPTEEMIKAGGEEFLAARDNTATTEWQDARSIYKAMLAASAKPSEGNK